MKKLLFLMLIALLTSALSGAETTDEDQMYKDLKVRRTMLDLHNYAAWGSVALMGGALLTTPDGGRSSTHKWLGIASGGLYASSALFAYLAPKPSDTPTKENIIWHKNLIWIHAPAMLLTVISGIQADRDYKAGKPQSTLAKLHNITAPIAAISFGTASIMSLDFTIQFLPSRKEQLCLFTHSF